MDTIYVWSQYRKKNKVPIKVMSFQILDFDKNVSTYLPLNLYLSAYPQQRSQSVLPVSTGYCRYIERLTVFSSFQEDKDLSDPLGDISLDDDFYGISNTKKPT